MKKHIKADDIKVVNVVADTAIAKQGAEQLIVRASAATVKLTHGADNAVFEEKAAVIGDLVEFNLVGVAEEFKLVGADLAILADFARLDNPKGKDFKGHTGKFVETV